MFRVSESIFNLFLKQMHKSRIIMLYVFFFGIVIYSLWLDGVEDQFL